MLKAARARALYWSGNPSFTGNRFVPGRRSRKNHAIEYEAALNDMENLSKSLEKLTGEKIKRYDPRSKAAKLWITAIEMSEKQGKTLLNPYKPSGPSPKIKG